MAWRRRTVGAAICLMVLVTGAGRVEARRPASTAHCAIDHVVYAQDGEHNGVTAGFARMQTPPSAVTDLLFWVQTPHDRYWFELYAPNGYGGTYIGPSLSPEAMKARDDALDAAPENEVPAEQVQPLKTSEGDQEDAPAMLAFDAFDDALRPYPSPPTSRDRAPARLFSRDLGPAFWYNAKGMKADGTGERTRESIAIAMFVPRDCR